MQKKFIGVCVTIICIVMLCGCLGSKIQTLTVVGSTTLLPIAQKCADAYMDEHPNVDIRVSAGGSSVGIQSVGEGTADIGMSSRDLKNVEKSRYPNLKCTVIAMDCIALIVNPKNPVTNLSIDQIRGIYNGTYTYWNELGGSDDKIVVIGRDSASGTREFFWKYVMHGEEFVSSQLEKNSNGAIKVTVSLTPGAIGYVSLGYVDASVKSLKVDGIEPTVENVLNRKYPIVRELLMVTQGTPEGLAKNYIDFVLSEKGQEIVASEGFVPLKRVT
jgi:phosphate transport system substrate-binding protein